MVLLTGTCITCAGTGEALTAASLVPGVAPDSVFGSGLCPPNLIPNCMAFGIPGGVWMGVHFLRNLLFLSVSLLDPNVITLYCLVFGSACTTTPLLSHILGLLPNWFCSITWWGSSLVPCFSFKCSLAPLGARASSLHSATFCQVSLRSLWRVREALGLEPGRKSCRSRPRSVCAGYRPVSWSGVFLRVRRPFTSMNVSSSSC